MKLVAFILLIPIFAQAYSPNVLMYLKGNSGQVQMYDWTGNGNTPVVVSGGAPGNPSTPTPPEGDKWWAYGVTSGGGTNITFPSSMFNPVPTQGCLVFYTKQGNQPSPYGYVLYSGAGPYINFYWGGGGGQIMACDFTTTTAGAKTLSWPIGYTYGTTATIRIKWSTTGFKYYANEVLTFENKWAINWPGSNPPTTGMGYPCCNRFFLEYYDAYMISTNPDEPFPPSEGVAAREQIVPVPTLHFKKGPAFLAPQQQAVPASQLRRVW